MKRVLILICLLLFIQSTFVGQTKSWKDFYDESFDYFYNGEYEKAISYLKVALDLDSTQSVIYWRLSCVLWIAAQREYKQKRNIKELKKRFNEITDKGIKICEKLLASAPKNKNTEVLFYLGALYGNRGWLVATTRPAWKWIFNRKKILKDLKMCQGKLKLIHWTKPFYHQSLIYLGMYNVFIEKNEQLGFKQLRDSFSYSKYKDDARIIYKGILQTKIEDNKFKDRIPEAIAMTENLLKKYPRNIEFKISLVILYWKKGELVKAKEMGNEVHKEILEHPEYPKAIDLVYLLHRLNNEIMPKIEKDLKKKK